MMNNAHKEALNALDELVEWAKKRELPPGEWANPIQDILKGDSVLSMLTTNFPFPFGIFNRDGLLEMGSEILLECMAYSEKDVREGKAYLYSIESVEFRNAIKMALNGETTVVNGLNKPLEDMGTGFAAESPNNMSAVIFPIFEDRMTIFRGAVLFLPFEYYPRKKINI